MHQAAMICMCEHEACSQFYKSQNIHLPRLPTHIHACPHQYQIDVPAS